MEPASESVCRANTDRGYTYCVIFLNRENFSRTFLRDYVFLAKVNIKIVYTRTHIYSHIIFAHLRSIIIKRATSHVSYRKRYISLKGIKAVALDRKDIISDLPLFFIGLLEDERSRIFLFM